MIWHIIQSSATMNIMYTKHNVHKNATLIVTTVTENYNTHCKISTELLYNACPVHKKTCQIVKIRDGKEPKILGSCSVRVL